MLFNRVEGFMILPMLNIFIAIVVFSIAIIIITEIFRYIKCLLIKRIMVQNHYLYFNVKTLDIDENIYFKKDLDDDPIYMKTLLSLSLKQIKQKYGG